MGLQGLQQGEVIMDHQAAVLALAAGGDLLSQVACMEGSCWLRTVLGHGLVGLRKMRLRERAVLLSRGEGHEVRQDKQHRKHRCVSIAWQATVV